MTVGSTDNQLDGRPLISVVVVEDQPDIAAALRELVEADGSAVVVAVCHTLEIGSEMVQRFLPDVVLTDFRLPDGDAVDQFARWHDAAPTTKILVASAWTDDRSVRRAMTAGASGYIEKGHHLMNLSAVISTVMAGDQVWPHAPVDASGGHAGAARSVSQRVLVGVLSDQTTEEIATDLGLTQVEVRQHVNVLLKAAGVRTRAALRDRHGGAG